MAGIIKPLGLSTSCNTTNISTFGGSKLVRLTCSVALTSSHTVTSKTPATFNANTSVDSTTYFITISNHIFKDFDSVVYSIDSGNTALTGLTDGTTYVVTASNTAGIKLASNTLNATNGTANNITKGLTESGHNLNRTNYSIVVTGGQSIILEKNTIDTLSSTDATATQLLGTAIAYKN